MLLAGLNLFHILLCLGSLGYCLRQTSNTYVLPQDTQGLSLRHGDLRTVYGGFFTLEILKLFTDAPIRVPIKHGLNIRIKILSSV